MAKRPMHISTEEQAISFLASYPGIGIQTLRKWLAICPSPLEIAHSDRSYLATLPGTKQTWLDHWPDPQAIAHWEKNWEWIKENGITLLTYDDPSFPRQLLPFSETPLLLYALGETKLLQAPSLAIVGTRNATDYGKEMAYRLSHDLAENGITVISGLARGIDTSAHQGALTTGTTIAVLGSGFKNIYPKENQHLATMIAKKGCLVSQFLPSTTPERFHFPLRNHVVSGLTSLGILLIEAPEKSGAMLTMQIGQQQGKNLFAIPGRADIPHFRGNHALLKRQIAQLVEKATDIPPLCDTLPGKAPLAPPMLPSLTNEEKTLLASIPDEEIPIEKLLHITDLSAGKLQALLMGLVMKRYLREMPGKRVRKTDAVLENARVVVS